MVRTELILVNTASDGIMLSVSEQVIRRQVGTRIDLTISPSNQVIEGTTISIIARLVDLERGFGVPGVNLQLYRNTVLVSTAQTDSSGNARWDILTTLADNNVTFSVNYMGNDVLLVA